MITKFSFELEIILLSVDLNVRPDRNMKGKELLQLGILNKDEDLKIKLYVIKIRM